MSVDSTAIDFDQARDNFAPTLTAPPKESDIQSSLAQLPEGALTKEQVQLTYEALVQAIIGTEETPTKRGATMTQLASKVIREGMNNAEDGDLTGRELKFAALCSLLAGFMRIQNPGLLSNIAQCVEQAVCALTPTPSATAAVFESLLHAFLYSIRLSKVSGLYHARRLMSKVVVYIPATNPPLVSDLVTLPDVTFRHCPLHETTHQMYTLEDLIVEDVAAGLLPVMVHTVVGMSPYSFSDNIPLLQELCLKYNMTLSLDGPGLALLLTNDPSIEGIVGAIKDKTLKLSLTLPLHHILPDFQTTLWMTYLRLPDMAGTLEMSTPNANPAALIGLYIYLSGTTAKALKWNVQRKIEQARYLHSALNALPCVEILTDPENVYAIKWRYSAPSGIDTGRQFDVQRVHNVLCRRWEEIAPARSALSIHDKYFSYLLLAHYLPTTLTDQIMDLFRACHELQQSISQCRLPMQVGIVNEEQLVSLPTPASAPFTLANFRFVPTFYKVTKDLSTEQLAELNLVNEKMGKNLRQQDPVFSSFVTSEGQVALSIAADPKTFQPIFTAEYIEKLLNMIKEVIDQMEKDDEVMMVIRDEVTKKGIVEAEEIIRKLKEEEEASESVLQLIPIVRAFTSWWYPLEKPALNPIHFDLRTTKVSMGPEFTS